MPLYGSAVLANWGGVAPGSERDYSRWHAMEHMPERLAVPGFLRGRRAVAEAHETDAPLFMMYEAETAAVFESEAYLARLNNPTPWTRRILSSYVRPIRTVCHVVDSLGDGIGGVLGSIRIDENDVRGRRVRIRGGHALSFPDRHAGNGLDRRPSSPRRSDGWPSRHGRESGTRKQRRS